MRTMRTAVAATALLALAACGGGTEAGTATPSSTTSSTSSSSSAASITEPTETSTSSTTTSTTTSETTESSSSSATSGDAEIDPVAAELVSKMIAGYASTTSVAGRMFIDGAGMSSEAPLATFGQTLADGEVSAIQMQLTIPGAGDFEIIAADGRLFLGGGFAEKYGNKYVEVSETTTDPTLAQLYTTFADTLTSASIGQYLTFLKLATQTEKVGTETIGGVEAEKYTMVLDLTRLDATEIDATTKASLEQLVAAGVTELPCTFWIDDAGQLVQVEQQVAVSGQSVQTKVEFFDYNAALTIAAPDPSLVVVAP